MGGGLTVPKKKKKHGRLCVHRGVLLKRMCHVMAALAVFVFPVGCAGTGPRQSLPCPLSGRRQEAGEPSLFPAQQQRLQLSRAHGELLRQNAYVHLINLSPTLFVSQFLSLVFSSISTHRRTYIQELLNTALKVPLVKSVAHVRPFPLSVIFNRWLRDINYL